MIRQSDRDALVTIGGVLRGLETCPSGAEVAWAKLIAAVARLNGVSLSDLFNRVIAASKTEIQVDG